MNPTSSPIAAPVTEIPRSDPRFPAVLADWLGPACPETLAVHGRAALLAGRPWALFCSRKCPGKLVVQTYELAQCWRDRGRVVIGGFHSPMEQECLRILLKSPHPVILCPARGLPRRVPLEWRRPLAEERLLLVSGFGSGLRRATVQTAVQRNRLVAALADNVFVAHAAPGSRSEDLCREVIRRQKPLYTLADDRNENLFALGARDINDLWLPAERPRPD